MKPNLRSVLSKRRRFFQVNSNFVVVGLGLLFVLYMVRSSADVAIPPFTNNGSHIDSVAKDPIGDNPILVQGRPNIATDEAFTLSGKFNDHVTLVFTTSVERQLETVIKLLGEEIAPFRDTEALANAERKFVAAGGGKISATSWKDAPTWLGYGFSSDRVTGSESAKFAATIRSHLSLPSGKQGRQWYFHSTFLPLTGVSWLEALKQATNGNVTCVFVRKSTIQEEVFHAMDEMETNRLSAREYRSVLLNVLMPRIKEACDQATKTLIYVQNGTEWELSDSFSHRAEFDSSKPGQQMLYKDAIKDDPEEERPTVAQEAKGEWPVLVRGDTEAYVSIMTASKSLKEIVSSNNPVEGVRGSDGNEVDYVEGAIGLGHSLAFFDATRERILLVTKSSLQDKDVIDKAASQGGWSIMEIDPIKDHWFNQCRFRPTRAHQNVRWGLMASKLRTLELDKAAVLYMDLDIVVTGRLRRLFKLIPPEYRLVSEGGVQHDYLNAGFLFIRPSKEVLDKILRYFESNPPPSIFNNLIDCTEMGLINSFFGLPDNLEEKSGRLVLKTHSPDDQVQGRTARLPLVSPSLSVGRPDVRRRHASQLPLGFHFIRKDICPKPWNVACSDVVRGTFQGCRENPEDDKCAVWERFLHRCDIIAYVAFCQFRGRTHSVQLSREVPTDLQS